ncbi:sigma-70 family RNA polymerase sigma factor [Novipirellula artificiosorum]|uniref:ECF sigma factor n=1 Tax=Novipirellula artificiosorum TaxID=2528016 RepID=A0A5C6DPX6_9BACT|nr:sigma-70 family RNA polymerase sigma factor [Novipirellula artificiosorum]TWU39333.1 ECF sigma factor [Novipirellula artificiosorum]
MTDVTQILYQLEQGDSSSADELLPLVYEELRRLAAARLKHEKSGQTLQATALVHEAYVRLVNVPEAQHWDSRAHFFGAAAEAMRRILVEQARRKNSVKRGGGRKRVDLGDVDLAGGGFELDVIALNDAIGRLEVEDSRAAQVVKLRFFCGMTIKQAAEAIGISPATADNDWAFARSWLRVQIFPENEGGNS